MATKKPMAKTNKKTEKNKKTKTPAPTKAKPQKGIAAKAASQPAAKKAPAKKVTVVKKTVSKPLPSKKATKASTPAGASTKSKVTAPPQKSSGTKASTTKPTAIKKPAPKTATKGTGKTVIVQTVKKTVKPSLPGAVPLKLTKSATTPLPSSPTVSVSAMDLAEMEPPPPLAVRVNDVIADDEMATLREMEANNEAVKRARENAKIKTPIGWDGVHCHECDGDIEPVRLRLGYYHCIGCAIELEKIAKIYGNQG